MRRLLSAILLLIFVVVTVGCNRHSTRPAKASPTHSEKWGYVDKAGRVAIGFTFDEVTPFHEGVAAVRVGKKWGFIDKQGRFIIKPAFRGSSRFSEGIACVETRRTSHDTEFDHSGDWNESVYIDKTGKHLFSFRAICCDFSNGLAAIGTGFNSMDGQPDKWGFVDKTGKTVIEQRFEDAQPFSEGLASVLPAGKGKWGYADPTGRFVAGPGFDMGSGFHEGLAAVTFKGKIGYIDKSGRLVIRPRFDDGGDFQCGRALVLLRDKYGYIDKRGAMCIRPQFFEANDFSDGLAAFRDTDTLKWGFVDVNGHIRLKAQYDDVMRFQEGLALVRIGDRSGYIDKNGKMVITRPPGSAYMSYDGQNQEQLSFSEGLVPFPSARLIMDR